MYEVMSGQEVTVVAGAAVFNANGTKPPLPLEELLLPPPPKEEIEGVVGVVGVD